MKATHNGTCQACGRTQAVNTRHGLLAKHGYTVDWGYFNGVCYGADHLPMEHDDSVMLRTCSQLEEMALNLETITAADITEVQAHVYSQAYGKLMPKLVGRKEYIATHEPEHMRGDIEFCNRKWLQAREAQVKRNHRQAEKYRSHIEFLKGLREERHGQELYPRDDESVERTRETGFANMRDAYARAEELKVDGWKPRVTRSGYDGVVLTATRAQ